MSLWTKFVELFLGEPRKNVNSTIPPPYALLTPGIGHARCAARGCLEVASHGVHKGRKQVCIIFFASSLESTSGQRIGFGPRFTPRSQTIGLCYRWDSAGEHSVCYRAHGGDSFPLPPRNPGTTRIARDGSGLPINSHWSTDHHDFGSRTTAVRLQAQRVHETKPE